MFQYDTFVIVSQVRVITGAPRRCARYRFMRRDSNVTPHERAVSSAGIQGSRVRGMSHALVLGMAMHERWKLTVARWTQLSLNVWTKDGFTALVQSDRLVVIAPTGARRTRKYVS